MNEAGFTPSDTAVPPPPPVTVAQITAQVQAQIRSDRPRRQAAIESVRTATRATQSNRRHEQEDAAERAILASQEQEAAEAATEAALEEAVNAQASGPPTTPDAWRAHVITGVAPAITYFHSRVNVEGGDRFPIAEFFRGARVFDPFFAANINHDEGLALIEKMRHYHILNQGEDSIIGRLKRGWRGHIG